ncbi:MAG TPA: hypothetical protein VFC25_06990 [Verrucomicrobiae bacterium]|nr:hypothetical protein [Verrucomicrobiae bacterium]
MNPDAPAQSAGFNSRAGEARPTFGDLARNALRYWEPRRVLYNAALFAVVLYEVWAAWPASKANLTADVLIFFFILAVLANIAYCGAYAVDLFVQFSGARNSWPRWRWCVLAVGIAFGAALTHFWAAAILSGTPSHG